MANDAPAQASIERSLSESPIAPTRARGMSSRAARRRQRSAWLAPRGCARKAHTPVSPSGNVASWTAALVDRSAEVQGRRHGVLLAQGEGHDHGPIAEGVVEPVDEHHTRRPAGHMSGKRAPRSAGEDPVDEADEGSERVRTGDDEQRAELAFRDPQALRRPSGCAADQRGAVGEDDRCADAQRPGGGYHRRSQASGRDRHRGARTPGARDRCAIDRRDGPVAAHERAVQVHGEQAARSRCGDPRHEAPARACAGRAGDAARRNSRPLVGIAPGASPGRNGARGPAA